MHMKNIQISFEVTANKLLQSAPLRSKLIAFKLQRLKSRKIEIDEMTENFQFFFFRETRR